MLVYVVFNPKAGTVLGAYDASNRAEALDTVAKDAGYLSYSASCAVTGQDELYASRVGRVIDYQTGVPLDGSPSGNLALASYEAGPEGAVRALHNGAHWVPDEAGTHTVFVEFE